jgi:hypothetical protein
MKVGDKMISCGETCEIIAVEREYKYPVPGRYTVRFESGRVIENYPGYLLDAPPSAAKDE